MGISRTPDYLGRAIQRKIRRMIDVESLRPTTIVIPGGRIAVPQWPVVPSDFGVGSQSGDVIVVGAGPGFVPDYTPQYADIEILINAGGAIIPAAEHKLDIPVDFACVIVGWSIYSDLAATVRFDIWSDTYANFPPVVGDTMPGANANKPQLVAAAKASGGVAGWTKTAITAGDIIRVNLDTNDLSKRLTLALKVRRT